MKKIIFLLLSLALIPLFAFASGLQYSTNSYSINVEKDILRDKNFADWQQLPESVVQKCARGSNDNDIASGTAYFAPALSKYCLETPFIVLQELDAYPMSTFVEAVNKLGYFDVVTVHGLSGEPTMYDVVKQPLVTVFGPSSLSKQVHRRGRMIVDVPNNRAYSYEASYYETTLGKKETLSYTAIFFGKSTAVRVSYYATYLRDYSTPQNGMSDKYQPPTGGMLDYFREFYSVIQGFTFTNGQEYDFGDVTPQKIPLYDAQVVTDNSQRNDNASFSYKWIIISALVVFVAWFFWVKMTEAIDNDQNHEKQ